MSFEDFAGTWQGCIKDRSPSMIETRGMDGYVLAILCHIHSNLSACAAGLEEAIPRRVYPHRPQSFLNRVLSGH
jgi:hypothetical protein